VRDFPYTGGGLDAFAGLFSQYIKVTPNFIIGYSHNLYLDVAIEQGLPGLAFFLFQLAEGVWLLLNAQHGSGLRGIVLAGLVVLLVHGLVDDPLYANRGTPFLFLIPALVVASSYNREDSPRETAKGAALSKIRLIGIALALIAATILAFIFRFPLLSAWDANIGAVQMARTELADFPSGKWDDGSRASQLASTEALFQKSLELDPMNVTANYRLGLIHMLRRDFPQALSYLEKAYTTAPGHRGVQKNLAYTFVWVGQLDRAQRLLRGIEEGQRELEVYTWWWTTQGRPDLAKQAEEMLVRLP
jgi:tetratricopeptide (TPR) repeat protein